MRMSLLVSMLVSLAWVAPAGAQPPPLPEGEGRELVQAICTQCHNTNQITNSGYNGAERWQEVFKAMVSMPDEHAHTISQYLATNFPEKPERRPVLVAGDATVKFTDWVVPTLGQRSRDTVEAPDGSIWWTGMWASLVGRLDPATGEMKEFALPPSARPHTIVPDEDGNIWYTGNSNATIGKLDPQTGEITEYPTRGRDPHSAGFHPNGNLYFTAQGANILGRLNPETGEVTEVDTEPRPYDIRVDADGDGTVWVAYNGTNKIAALNPDTMAIRYYDVPNENSRVRRLGFSSDGMVWYGNSGMGRVGRLNPATGEIQEWDSPSGPRSNPYGFAVVDDIIWYNESGMRPDTLVRFDPKTEQFQSWAIPSGIGTVRNIWVTRAGNLLIHQTGANRIGLVEIGASPTGGVTQQP